LVRKVEVIPYDPNWAGAYLKEVVILQEALSPLKVSFHHVGSTAVAGLAAKPTIDILAVVDSLVLLDGKNTAMEKLGYRVKGENGIPGRRYYQKLQGEVHLVHIHAFMVGHPDIVRHLNFRDYLRTHPETARAYAALKLDLARSFPLDAKAYTNNKTDFIREVDQKAAAWRKEESGDENEITPQ
jgi:GrpB-like predicted nucleotidyltransferase (UPF0157 family)